MSSGKLVFVAACLVAASRAATPVILISIDTLRADHLNAYGYRRIRTPNIDSFARGGTIFAQVDTQIPLTLPSHTALLTSTYPFESGVEENGVRVPSNLLTLAAVLQSHGYKTAAFVGSCLLNRELGLDRGFDFYDSPFNLQGGSPENPYSVRVRRDGALVVRAARQWLDANRGQAVFAFLHFFDLHTPYSAGGYDSEIAYVDQLLGRLRQILEQSGWWERSLVILLSDHGESLGEHGENTHGYFIYQSTSHVPLIFHWPAGAAQHPKRVDEPAGLIDVAPTILDFLHIPQPASFHGSSLLQSAPPAVYTESMYPRDAFHWAPLRSLRVGGRKYIRAPKPELYVLSGDPRELVNLYRAHQAEAHGMETQLAALLARYTRKPTVSGVPGQAEALGSLGYAAGATRLVTQDAGPDPKDRLAEYNQYEKALTALYGGNPLAAIATFRALLTKDQRNTMARYYLGDAYLRARRPDDAAREWAETLERDPEYAPAAEALGAFWLARQDYAKARGYFKEALALAPGDYAARFELGELAEHQGNFKDALEEFEAACKIAPEAAQCGKELQDIRERAR
jgi:arylsulfatase A-like enzyme